MSFKQQREGVVWAGEMAQQLSALAPLPEDLGLDPTTTQQFTMICNSGARGLLLASEGISPTGSEH